MKIRLYGDQVDLIDAVKELIRDREICISDDGFPVEVEMGAGHLKVECMETNARIRFERKHLFFRALGLFIEHFMHSKSFILEETAQFKSVGTLFDLSRNAVFQVESVKRMLRHMAWMGMDRLLLYMEDTFEIPEMPYFGYFRGRYTFEELKEIDDYAHAFGMEVVPVIQTLGHLKQALKWNVDPAISDNEDILMVDDPGTYEMIDRMIRAATSPLRSRRIHLGMDEADQVGLGRYLKKNGYKDRFKLMTGHLSKVIEIAHSYDLEPMIWSDMYFKAASKEGGYYERDTVLPEEVRSEMPAGVDFVYWDYYSEDEDHYRSMIRKHDGLGQRSVFAGGIWTFVGVNVNYDKTFATSSAALSACKLEKVDEIFATVWGDDGAETNYFTALPGMQLYAEHAYAQEVDPDRMKDRFRICTGASWDAFMNLSLIDHIPGVRQPNLIPANPSKALLWQDLLTGLFDPCVKELHVAAHYAKVMLQMEKHAEENASWSFLFATAARLCEVLEVKADIGLKMKTSYENGRKEQLAQLAYNVLPRLYDSVDALRLAHSAQWMATYKPFGWEVLDVRYGGLLARIRSASSRIDDYVKGVIDRLEEFEVERLPFDPHSAEAYRFGCLNAYARIFSASS